MSIARLALLIPSVSLLCGCGDAGTEPSAGARYFPLTVGSTWTYAPPDPLYGEPFQWQVTGRRGDTVTVARPSGGSHPGPVTLLDRQDAVDLIVGDQAAVPLYRFTEGVEWTRHDPWECDDGSRWLAVEEPSPVTTPAGTFPATLRMERRTTASCTDAGTTLEWWARGVGLVQWEELNFYAGGTLTFVLITHDRE